MNYWQAVAIGMAILACVLQQYFFNTQRAALAVSREFGADLRTEILPVWWYGASAVSSVVSIAAVILVFIHFEWFHALLLGAHYFIGVPILYPVSPPSKVYCLELVRSTIASNIADLTSGMVRHRQRGEALLNVVDDLIQAADRDRAEPHANGYDLIMSMVNESDQKERRREQVVASAVEQSDVREFLSSRGLSSEHLSALRRLLDLCGERGRADAALSNVEMLDWFFAQPAGTELPDLHFASEEHMVQFINWVRYGSVPNFHPGELSSDE